MMTVDGYKNIARKTQRLRVSSDSAVMKSILAKESRSKGSSRHVRIEKVHAFARRRNGCPANYRGPKLCRHIEPRRPHAWQPHTYRNADGDQHTDNITESGDRGHMDSG